MAYEHTYTYVRRYVTHAYACAYTYSLSRALDSFPIPGAGRPASAAWLKLRLLLCDVGHHFRLAHRGLAQSYSRYSDSLGGHLLKSEDATAAPQLRGERLQPCSSGGAGFT